MKLKELQVAAENAAKIEQFNRAFNVLRHSGDKPVYFKLTDEEFEVPAVAMLRLLAEEINRLVQELTAFGVDDLPQHDLHTKSIE